MSKLTMEHKRSFSKSMAKLGSVLDDMEVSNNYVTKAPDAATKAEEGKTFMAKERRQRRDYSS
ncbi:hypothetical protein L7F22_023823, partial [Adiantum nelumboides]|nr:hypothetical protein [Adiantum nelumboides]